MVAGHDYQCVCSNPSKSRRLFLFVGYVLSKIESVKGGCCEYDLTRMILSSIHL